MGAVIALGHHEKFDGTGYPHGLVGDNIPLPARIVAVADVFDALTSDRPYKHAWSFEDALKFIRTESGRHFDPDCVRAFEKRIDAVAAIMRELGDQG
jgi:two-component system response regulator RpfG